MYRHPNPYIKEQWYNTWWFEFTQGIKAPICVLILPFLLIAAYGTKAWFCLVDTIKGRAAKERE